MLIWDPGTFPSFEEFATQFLHGPMVPAVPAGHLQNTGSSSRLCKEAWRKSAPRTCDRFQSIRMSCHWSKLIFVLPAFTAIVLPATREGVPGGYPTAFKVGVETEKTSTEAVLVSNLVGPWRHWRRCHTKASCCFMVVMPAFDTRH